MAAIKGGEKLEAALADLSRKVARPAVLKVGFLEGATYPDGTSVAQVAAWQEFGTATIPPRPFFRNMVSAKSGEWPKAVAANLRATDFDAERTLDLMGEGISGQLRQSIVDTNEPPLSPVTLMLRKMRADNPGLVVTGRTVGEAAARVAAGQSYEGASTKPLVDSGDLLRDVSYEVSTK